MVRKMEMIKVFVIINLPKRAAIATELRKVFVIINLPKRAAIATELRKVFVTINLLLCTIVVMDIEGPTGKVQMPKLER